MEKQVLDVKEVVELTGLPRLTVYEMGRSGAIPGRIKVGRRVLFSRSKVFQWLAADGGSNGSAGNNG